MILQSPENDELKASFSYCYSTNLHVLNDGTGIVLSFTATSGQTYESTEFENLFLNCPRRLQRISNRSDTIASDKGNSSQAIRTWIQDRDIKGPSQLG
jgi:hypothetical protein